MLLPIVIFAVGLFGAQAATSDRIGIYDAAITSQMIGDKCICRPSNGGSTYVASSTPLRCTDSGVCTATSPNKPSFCECFEIQAYADVPEDVSFTLAQVAGTDTGGHATLLINAVNYTQAGVGFQAYLYHYERIGLLSRADVRRYSVSRPTGNPVSLPQMPWLRSFGGGVVTTTVVNHMAVLGAVRAGETLPRPSSFHS